jgi:hypothetical protein
MVPAKLDSYQYSYIMRPYAKFDSNIGTYVGQTGYIYEPNQGEIG